MTTPVTFKSWMELDKMLGKDFRAFVAQEAEFMSYELREIVERYVKKED